MGTIHHNAIIATGYEEDVPKFQQWLASYDGERPNPIAVTEQATNGYQTIIIAPDGSKEGWGTSNNGDAFRAAVIDYLKSCDDAWDWVEIGYGEFGADVSQTNCTNHYEP